MIDSTTTKPLRVSTDGNAGPYIMVPTNQLDDLVCLLDRRHVPHSVQELFLSIDDGPEMATVDLGLKADADAVQAVLDDAD